MDDVLADLMVDRKAALKVTWLVYLWDVYSADGWVYLWADGKDLHLAVYWVDEMVEMKAGLLGVLMVVL